METLEIGPVPANESCEQLGPNYSSQRARHECARFIEAIKLACGEPPEKASLIIKGNPHDYGTYYEVAVKYDPEDGDAVSYACIVEGNAPTDWKFNVGEKEHDCTPNYRKAPLPADSKRNWWVGSPPKCDVHVGAQPELNEFIDGKTIHGPWANMCAECWARVGVGRLGMGFGQRYEKLSDGRFLKMEG